MLASLLVSTYSLVHWSGPQCGYVLTKDRRLRPGHSSSHRSARQHHIRRVLLRLLRRLTPARPRELPLAELSAASWLYRFDCLLQPVDRAHTAENRPTVCSQSPSSRDSLLILDFPANWKMALGEPTLLPEGVSANNGNRSRGEQDVDRWSPPRTIDQFFHIVRGILT